MSLNPPADSKRRYRQLHSPLSVTVRGQTYHAEHWSPGGMLLRIPATEFREGRPESTTLHLPCSDGVHPVPVTAFPTRKQREGWLCDFIDLPPKITATLITYADAMLHGFQITTADLDRAAADPESAEEAVHLIEEAPAGRFSQAWKEFPLKRLLFATFFALLILGVASLIVPFFVNRLMARITQGDSYLKIGRSRMQNAETEIKDLEAKIKTIKAILDPNSLHLEVSPEQRQLLLLGLGQLENEREEMRVHHEIFRANVESIQQGNYFFEQSVLRSYDTAAHTDPAPYLTQILTDIAASSRLAPHSPDDIQKYRYVARARVDQAEAELSAAQVQRAALEKILARSSAQKQSGALPFNTLELLQRDIDLLHIDETRLQKMLVVLRDNIQAVEHGNFTYETNLLERFNPQPMRPAATNDSAVIR